MKLRDSAAGALAAWQAMTMTGPYAPATPSAAPAVDQSAVSAWSAMTGTTPSAPQSLPAGAPFQPGTAGGFAVTEPAKPGPGAWAAPISGSYAGMGAATTPLVDNPTQLPSLPAAKNVPSTATHPPKPLTDQEALATAGYDPSLSPQAPAATPDDKRGLTVDEKRFVQGNELLGAAYSQGYAVAPHLGSAGMPPPKDVSGPPGARIDGYQIKVAETFDKGAGIFSNHWGPGTDTSVPGQITVWTSADNQSSGMMTRPEGYGTPSGGWGYGLYSFTLSTEGKIGVYALTWPATDVWPGPEMDVLEIDAGGKGYSAIHNKGDGNSNQFDIKGWGDADLRGVNTYQMLWEAGRLTGYLNGQQRWTTTDNVPKDYAHGGENTAPGIGAETYWNDGAMGGKNRITLYGFSYEGAP